MNFDGYFEKIKNQIKKLNHLKSYLYGEKGRISVTSGFHLELNEDD